MLIGSGIAVLFSTMKQPFASTDAAAVADDPNQNSKTELILHVIDSHGQAIDSVATVIERRLVKRRVSDPRVQITSDDRLKVSFRTADAEETARVKALILRRGRLEFRLVADNPTLVRRALLQNDVPMGYRVYSVQSRHVDRTERLLVSDVPEFAGNFVAQADVSVNEQTGEREVHVAFNQQGRGAFYEVTGRNIGERLAIIIYCIRGQDGQIAWPGVLVSAPVIRQHITGTATISGNFALSGAEDLAAVLESGCLDAEIVAE